MTSAAYLFGRAATELKPATGGSDALFASQRADGSQFNKQVFEHCTFANVSFKDCQMEDITFLDCIFMNCYFRGTRIQDCRFSACKFIDCDLVKIDIRTSDLKYYNSFNGCYIPFGELAGSLPSEGNLREHLCLNLAEEAASAGALKDAGLYQQAGARGREEHLKAAFLHSSEFYRNKYRGMERIEALTQYIASRLRGYLWGYRRSFLTILRNWAVVTLALFPLVFWPLENGLHINGKAVHAGDIWVASMGNMLPGSGISQVSYVSASTRTVAFVEVLVGLLFAGLAASLLFRAVFDRRR